jgi:C4-type Zn-finger protein
VPRTTLQGHLEDHVKSGKKSFHTLISVQYGQSRVLTDTAEKNKIEELQTKKLNQMLLQKEMFQ